MINKSVGKSGIVYSTEHGTMCPACGKPLAKCSCPQKIPEIQGDGNVRIAWETKGRKGSGVTVITGLPAPIDALKTLAKTLKRKCGCGGTVKNGSLEIQGDHRDLLLAELQELGYKVKCTGR
ncbi:MAG: translation initiation factor Sui1 [Desulfobulbaceae bacterium]|nr:translation initiation factor Sui1 [Desulfobulbaceae bacterium]